jgi:hypothetical protein
VDATLVTRRLNAGGIAHFTIVNRPRMAGLAVCLRHRTFVNCLEENEELIDTQLDITKLTDKVDAACGQ